MNRKIAAIFAADIAGYSKLVAEDEEETLRRLASYRAVMDDFIARAGGRIFNTAGDAVLAEFSSAVEAVRCAIDIQESLRTRNMAYPASRQMCFRIGITVGDVVERDGDLLGDGVNIAARLEGIAPVGGICISRTVHEQVANKLSVQFADIGEQQVKNIPTPVHAYQIRDAAGRCATDASRAQDAGSSRRCDRRWRFRSPSPVLASLLLVIGGDRLQSWSQPGAPQPKRKPPTRSRRRTAAPLRRHRPRRASPPTRRLPAARGRGAGAGNDPLHHRPRPRRGSQRIYVGRRSQGAGDQRRPDRLELRARPTTRRQSRGARYVPEARRCAAAAAAQMRALCGRQYGRVRRAAIRRCRRRPG